MSVPATGCAPTDVLFGETVARPEADVALSPGIREQLFEPAIWQADLQKYALATNLAVALTDAQGQLLGQCINPQPTWSLLHGKKPSAAGPCPFSLAPITRCTCVTDALQTGGLIVAHEAAGFVHFTVPLAIGRQPLGALVGGQVFDHYPEQLPLERVAEKFGLSPNQVFHMACREHPIKQSTLRVYADLLAALGRTFLQTRYHTILEAKRLAEMMRLRDLLQERTLELIAADRRKDEFLAMLAHELRNPLAPIRSAVQVMRRLGEGDANLPWAMDVVDRQVQHMTRLVDDLLDVARLSRGKISLHKEPVNLDTVVSRAVETSRPIIDARRHQLTVSLPAERVVVEGDLIRLAQVLANLLNNAAKYTEEGGLIGLTVEREGGTALVRVRDTGMGIATEMVPHLFALFTQANQALARSQGGLGVGLALVRRLVTLHGGSVQAFSDGPGRGSEFVVRLPVLPKEKWRADGPEKGYRPNLPSLARRILVVDDNIDAADTLALFLKLAGHEVLVAHDGPAAVTTAEGFQPQVVVLDIGLPEMDGYEVARRLRENPLLEDVLLVALTGYGSDEDRDRSQRAGIDYHLVKPADPGALQKLLVDPKTTTPSNDLT